MTARAAVSCSLADNSGAMEPDAGWENRSSMDWSFHLPLRAVESNTPFGDAAVTAAAMRPSLPR
jgi:hypothetical protein